jgi:folate-dependent tRNA-U54 methylase TrmFO/GidA
MNVNFGIFEPLGINVRKSERKDEYVRRSLEVIEKYKKEYLDD